MNLFRSTRSALFAAATVLGLGMAGCSTSSDPGVQSSAPEPSLSAETPSGGTTPSMEPSGPEAPRPTGNGGPAIALAQLPVGGGSEETDDEEQCATASWNQPDLLPDNGVRVTKVEITPSRGFAVAGKCGDSPACRSFTFRKGDLSCSVEVRGRGEDRAELTLRGGFTCPPGQESSCGGRISLHGLTGSDTSVTESSPSSAVSSSSPGG